jgi:RNA polymerase sigma-70 factor (ECF subfamily)
MWPLADETLQLLNSVRDGEAAAVDRLLARHRPALRRMIALRLDPALAARLDASDVVQDVLLEASRRLRDYLQSPAMPFHLWLRSIAQDHVVDAHRRHRQAQKRSLDREQPLAPAALADRSSLELAAAFLDPELTPASAAIRSELKKRFEAALEELDENDREIILMRHFEQMGNQEVAAALGVSEPTAGMRYLRALRRLRQQLLGSDSLSTDGKPR